MIPTPPSSNLFLSVRMWLYSVAVLVVVMVLVGGATRLTDSGLSITEWALIRGTFPPLSLADWLIEFDKYKTTTEFQTINSFMTLDEFKTIYWWEWGHRFLGRFIGFVVIVPMAYFWIAGKLDRWLKWRLLVWLLLGSMQGVVGWWMVKSGLVGRVDVSHLRLAIHLTLACIVFSMTIWLARSLVQHSRSDAKQGFASANALMVLVFAQIFLGGLVAGLDAGMAYNTWPTMNGDMIPQAIWSMSPTWYNFLDNAAMVQFLHRLTAYAVLVLALMHAIRLGRSDPASTHSRRGWVLFALVTLQAVIGIFTLVLQVPLHWALAHQFGAILVLAFLTAHRRALSPRDPCLVASQTNTQMKAKYG